jgi:hypothetical protein
VLGAGIADPGVALRERSRRAGASALLGLIGQVPVWPAPGNHDAGSRPRDGPREPRRTPRHAAVRQVQVCTCRVCAAGPLRPSLATSASRPP